MGIIGSGQMGLGIAYVAANVTRLPVVLMDVSQVQTDKGLQFMGKNVKSCHFLYLMTNTHI